MLTPSELAQSFITIGKNKAGLSPTRQFVLGIFAGIFIAVTGAATVIGSAAIENPSVAKMVMAIIFPGGLTMVLLAGSELFTGNNLMMISVLEGKVSLKAMLRNWLIVYLGNLVGSLFVAILLVYGHTPSLFAGLAEAFVKVARGKATLNFTDALFRGIFCNILVCIAVWIAAASRSMAGKVIGLYFPIALFVLCGFEHCVANMLYIPAGLLTMSEYGIAAEGLTWGSFLLHNLLPVTLGNIIGGAGIIGGGYWFVYLRGQGGKL